MYKQYVEIFVTVLAPLLLLLALNFRIIYAIRYQTLRLGPHVCYLWNHNNPITITFHIPTTTTTTIVTEYQIGGRMVHFIILKKVLTQLFQITSDNCLKKTCIRIAKLIFLHYNAQDPEHFERETRAVPHLPSRLHRRRFPLLPQPQVLPCLLQRAWCQCFIFRLIRLTLSLFFLRLDQINDDFVHLLSLSCHLINKEFIIVHLLYLFSHQINKDSIIVHLASLSCHQINKDFIIVHILSLSCHKRIAWDILGGANPEEHGVWASRGESAVVCLCPWFFLHFWHGHNPYFSPLFIKLCICYRAWKLFDQTTLHSFCTRATKSWADMKTTWLFSHSIKVSRLRDTWQQGDIDCSALPFGFGGNGEFERE